MSLIVSALILFLLASLIVLVRAIAHAPEGYEDASGFHFTNKAEADARVSRREAHGHAYAESSLPRHAA
jgi:hypothetical protein